MRSPLRVSCVAGTMITTRFTVCIAGLLCVAGLFVRSGGSLCAAGLLCVAGLLVRSGAGQEKAEAAAQRWLHKLKSQ